MMSVLLRSTSTTSSERCHYAIFVAIVILLAIVPYSNSSQSVPSSLDIVAQYTLPGSSVPSFTKGPGSGSNVTTTTNLSSRAYFTHLAYDSKRSVLYAGATNRIIQLDENLLVLAHAVTGPKHDSPQCHAAGCPEEVETSQTNNHNKILIVNQVGDTLIACGSIHQGACEMYNLTKFPDNPKFIGIALAANDEHHSTYAFIGPSKYNAWHTSDVLYVGTTFTTVGDYRHDVPAISSRKLDDLSFAEFSIQQSIINIDVKYRDQFLVDYVYGFNSSEYAYFMIVQKKSHLAEEAGYVTRLARICISDSNYDSYTEITIQCLATHSNVDYNILRDAKITQAGQKLGQQLDIKRDDYVLVAAFSPSKEITNQPEPKSAICVYSLKEIDEVFAENIHMCFNGTIKDRNLGYISGTINDGKCPLVGVGSLQLLLFVVPPGSLHMLCYFSRTIF